MTSADIRGKPNSKPWKPEVTPPRRRGNFRGKGGRQNDTGRQASNNIGTNGNSGSGRNFDGRNQSRNSGNCNRSFGKFDTSPNVRRPRVASKTIDKDKGRCFYCNEFGLFIRECPKKIENEKFRRFSRMGADYDQDDQYLDYDDTGIYTDDYDNEVFATLNS